MPRRSHSQDIWKQLKNDPNVRRAIEQLRQRVQQASHRPGKTIIDTTKADASREIQYQPPKPQLYGSTSGKSAWGIAKVVLGSLLGSVSFLAAIAGLIVLIVGEGPLLLLSMLALLGGSGLLLYSGIHTLNLVSRFKRYCRALGQKTHCALDQLAKAVGKQEQFVRKDIQKMIGQGFFLEGHLDQEQTTLITSHETYRHFEQSRLAYERQKQLEAQEKAAAQKAKEERERQAAKNPKVQAVLTQGQDYLAEIRCCNDAIPGQAVSEKISRLELIVQKILHRLETDPEVVDDLKKMMDYYLPMTVKLLKAYADMDAQPIEGETIAASKQEIEETLDILNLAFEKLLDSIFQETAMDVSSDISVLQTLLAQEGLTEDPLEQLKKQKNP